MLMAAVWAVLGERVFRILFGPLCFLFFSIPFGHDALPVLMDWTADATVAWLRLSGVPVFQHDRSFIIPSGSWSVVEACSGIRYLLTSFFVGSIFAYMTYTRWLKRVAFVFWMLLASLLANWVRAYAIVMIAHLSNNEWGLGLSHLAFGWVIFAVTVVGSFAIGIRWSDPEPRHEPGPLGTVTGLPVVVGLALATLIMAAGWQFAASSLLNRAPAKSFELDLSAVLNGMTPVRPALPMVVPQFVGASALHQSAYAFDGGDIGLTVAYYRNQRQGAELVSVNNLLEPTHNWAWSSSRMLASMGDGLPAMRLESYSGSDKEALVATVYWVGGYTTTSATASKIYQAINLVSGRGDDGAMIVITSTDHGAEANTRRVEAFVRERLPGLLRSLDATARNKP
jgi:EpsI family protein